MSAHKISNIGSERATGGKGSKITTFDGITHVVWQDISRKGYLNQIRSFDHATGDWSETYTLNHGIDNHARPVVAIDSEGYIHTIMSGHGSPVSYRRSTNPNDASDFRPPEIAGAGTYPILLCDSEDTIYSTVRAPDADGVDLYTKPKGEACNLINKLITRTDRYRTGYAAFHNYICFGPDGTLHFVAAFYEGTGRTENRGLHQAICYMRSVDRGRSWRKSDGTEIELPAIPERMDIIARSETVRHEPMPTPEVSCGGIVTSPGGEVSIFCVSHRERPGEIVEYRIDLDGFWSERKIPIDESFPHERPIDSSFGSRDDGTVYGLITLAPLSHGWLQGKPMRESNPEELPDERAVWVTNDQDSDLFRFITEIEPGRKFNTVTIERATGANIVSAGSFPSYMFFEGTSRYPGGMLEYFADIEGYVKKGELITNNVLWVAPRKIVPGTTP